MNKCQWRDCGKTLHGKHNKRYCGNQREKGSCAHKALLEANRIRMKENYDINEGRKLKNEPDHDGVMSSGYF